MDLAVGYNGIQEDIMTESGTTTDIQTLIQEGNAALLAGDTFEARQRFRRVIEIDPEHVDALKGLAGSVRPYREKRDYLQQALALDPANGEVRAFLEYVDAKLAAGEVLAPRGVSIQDVPGVDVSTSGEPTTATAENGSRYAPLAPEDEAETTLSCVSCGTPLTDMKGVVWTPVGQLCAECARVRRPRNYQVEPGHLAIAASVALISSILVSILVIVVLGRVGLFSFLIAFFVAPIVAEFIVRMLDRLTGAKRGRSMQIAVGVGLAVGAAPLMLFTFSLPLLLFMIIGISTAVARLR
jgi:hypothetical protein